MPESRDENCLMLIKDAFKRNMMEQLGPIEDKPPIELGAWSLALIELAHEVRCRRRCQEQIALSLEESRSV